MFKTLLLLATVCLNAHAFEADYYTHRAPFTDSAELLDGKMNAALREIAASSRSCETTSLHEALMGKLGGFLQSAVESWPTGFKPTLHQSIYAGLGLQAPFLSLGCCAVVFKVGDALVSGDKLGHFVHSGFEMFYVVHSLSYAPIADSRGMIAKVFDFWESPVAGPLIEHVKTRMGLENRRLSEAEIRTLGETIVLEVSSEQENNSMGLGSTGVRSYGDMAANLEGYHFWTELTQGSKPFFTCTKGKWELAREFHWEQYTSDAWDEGINCNSYGPIYMRDTINQRIARLAALNQWPSATCPIDPRKCDALALRYGDLAPKVLHPDCLAAARARLAVH
jgi:hypothetical protein